MFTALVLERFKDVALERVNTPFLIVVVPPVLPIVTFAEPPMLTSVANELKTSPVAPALLE